MLFKLSILCTVFIFHIYYLVVLLLVLGAPVLVSSSTAAKPISGDVEAPQLQGVFKTSRLLTDKDADIFSVSRIAAKIKLQAN